MQQSADPTGSDAVSAGAGGAEGTEAVPFDVESIVETAATTDWTSWAWFSGKIAAAIVIGLIVHAIVFAAARRLVARTSTSIDNRLAARLRRPSLVIFPLLALLAMTPTIRRLTPEQVTILRHVISLATIAAVTWLLVALVGVAEEAIRSRHRVDVADNLEARRVHTQVAVLTRTIMVFLVVLGVAAALMTFPRIRELGASLLVSAGFAGLVIGLAARPVLENLIAGVQLAFTQPIRLDDVVIVQGEWGRIEEITPTYVVVKIWDERRLIVPFSKFIHEPFQNWTRQTADILGTVFVHADYRVNVETVREALRKIVEQCPQWDGKVCNLQVTDTTERTVQLRALVSAAGSGDAWDLRVRVREELLAWLQREHPEWLPKVRVETPGLPSGRADEAAASTS